MKYYHLTATVNEMITDVLVSEDELTANPDLADYFLYGASDIVNQGAVEILPAHGNNHILPEVIG